jgi:arginine utilization regulatory protein
MPLALQGKLLRVLQEKKNRRVGSLENTPLDCKVICSVNEDPQQLVKNGRFRMDLFYRLAVVYVHIPPLRERLVDIEELGRYFLQKFSRMLGKNLKNISAEVIDFFWSYSWPGNVRELEHIIESAVNMASDSDDTLKLEHCYFSNLLGISDETAASSVNRPDPSFAYPHRSPAKGIAERQSLSAATNSLEKEKIIDALTMSGGNIAAAARILSISRQLLGHKINKFNLRSFLNGIRSS